MAAHRGLAKCTGCDSSPGRGRDHIHHQIEWWIRLRNRNNASLPFWSCVPFPQQKYFPSFKYLLPFHFPGNSAFLIRGGHSHSLLTLSEVDWPEVNWGGTRSVGRSNEQLRDMYTHNVGMGMGVKVGAHKADAVRWLLVA